MDSQIKAGLMAAGVDVDEALERFMGSEAMLSRFLKKFPADQGFATLTAALEAGDHEGAVNAAHTLKGLCGNDVAVGEEAVDIRVLPQRLLNHLTVIHRIELYYLCHDLQKWNPIFGAHLTETYHAAVRWHRRICKTSDVKQVFTS